MGFGETIGLEFVSQLAMWNNHGHKFGYTLNSSFFTIPRYVTTRRTNASGLCVFA